MNTLYERYEEWLKNTDPSTIEELSAIKDNEDEIKNRFSSYLSFGTAGLRGIMKAGTCAMNVYTVRNATQGFADYINGSGMAEKGIVIACDSRNNSELFAREAASVMAANGIPCYIFDTLRPTPVLSFAVRELGCAAGINITASHNPKEYNGYKAYGEDGSQLSPAAAEAVSERIRASSFFADVKTLDFEEGVKSGKIRVLDYDFDERYIAKVLEQQTYPGLISSVSEELSVVYTPLHGAGHRLVPEVLSRCGLKNIHPVKEQFVLDGDFPTVKYPNPEFPEVFGLGIKIADEKGSDLIIATDPDADRVGIAVRVNDGSFMTLTGNQVGALLLEYMLSAYEEQDSMPFAPYAVKSIVSTPLADEVCKRHGVRMFNVLTGFKFIGEVITAHEEAGDGSFILGFEESYGYLKGTYARDKDAVVASMLITEMAAFYRKKGMSLYEALTELYSKYGYYLEGVENITMAGLDGAEKMKALMERLRKEPPASLGGDRVLKIRDCLSGEIKDLITGESDKTGLPSSDVLYYDTEGGNAVIVRPSGTEPKVKIYYLLRGKSKSEAEKTLEAYKASVKALM